MTAAALIADLRARGVRLIADGNQLRFRPRSACTPGELDLLRRCKSEVLAALADEDERLLNASLDEFEQDHRGIQLRVPWLEETLWFVPRVEHVATLVGQGVSRGRIWTAGELRDVASLDRADIESIALLRAAFGAEIVAIETGSAPTPATPTETTSSAPVPCYACSGTRLWKSIHGATVCGTCHPPGAPELVVGWIDAKGEAP